LGKFADERWRARRGSGEAGDAFLSSFAEPRPGTRAGRLVKFGVRGSLCWHSCRRRVARENPLLNFQSLWLGSGGLRELSRKIFARGGENLGERRCET
jgi:hypothetical protein